jgi:flagellar basal body-associated protein FliL
VASYRVNFTFTFIIIIIIIIIIIRGGCVNIFVVSSALAPSTPVQKSGDFRSSVCSNSYQH